MKADVASLVLILLELIKYSSTKNFHCSYIYVKLEILDDAFLTCEYKNIVFRGRNETFTTILLNDLPKNLTTDYIYDDIDEYVKRVSFKSSRIYSIPNSIFTTFKNLHIFDATRTRLHEINSLSFNKAEFLNFVYLHDNKLTIIRDYTFVHCKNLKVLDLSSNHISEVQKFSFNSLINLEQLNLANNKIKSIEDDTFQSLVSVYWIWLNNNQIEFLSANVFGSENSNLIGINLDGNGALNAISINTFRELKKLRFLFLVGGRCINKNFKNHVIYNNVAVKFALKTCIENYKQMFPDEDMDVDLRDECITFVNARKEELKFLEEEIRKRMEYQN